MEQTLGYVTIVVRDYDEAISFFSQKLGVELVEGSASKDREGRDKRWVVVAPRGVSRNVSASCCGRNSLMRLCE